MFKKILVVTSFALIPSVASTQGYIEGSIGAAFVGDLKTQVPGGLVPDVPGGTLSAGIGTELLFGAELGVAVPASVNTRWGVSWDHVNANLDSIGVSGFGLPGSVSVDCSTVDAIIEETFGVITDCSEVDESVHVIAGNAYIDFPVGDQAFIQPFVGVGAGYAFFQDAGGELALSGSAGARIPLGMNAYVGGRYRFQWINGPTDDLGIEYDPITMHGVSAILGFQF